MNIMQKASHQVTLFGIQARIGLFCKVINKEKGGKDHAVNTKALEIVFFDKAEQKANGKKRNGEGNGRACQKQPKLGGGKSESEIKKLDGRCTEHNGNGEEEGKLGGNLSGATEQNGRQNGRARAGGAGDDG